MRSFWSDPYLWVHLAGAAALPIFLELCLLGLAVGDPGLPALLELGFVAAVGIAPIFWMQWQRPFYIFSLLAIALQPAQLTDEQRRLLRLFKTKEVRVLTAIAPIILTIALWQLYKLAPLAAEVTPFAGSGRLIGLVVAAIAFLACNLFLQVPLSVLRVMLAGEAEFAAVQPYPPERIGQDFTVLGLRVKQILPAIAPPPKPVAVADGGASAVEAVADEGAQSAVVPQLTPTPATPDAAVEASPSDAQVTPADQPSPAATDTAVETGSGAEVSQVGETIAAEATAEAEAASVVEEQVAEDVIEEMLEGRSPDAQPDAQPDVQPDAQPDALPESEEPSESGKAAESSSESHDP